jgi:hypothetical protein
MINGSENSVAHQFTACAQELKLKKQRRGHVIVTRRDQDTLPDFIMRLIGLLLGR